MSVISELLIGIRDLVELYETMLKQICEEYDLTLMEANIISFLYHNPEYDTASDIVRLRHFSKGAVSQAVESLIQKSMIKRSPDDQDRRKIHLFLLPAADPITNQMERIQQIYQQQIFTGFSTEEKQAFIAMHDRMMKNIHIKED
ncbi:MAG: MarR family winged helix-turn-helix transcriptional regulator [Massiliimalia sp.]